MPGGSVCQLARGSFRVYSRVLQRLEAAGTDASGCAMLQHFIVGNVCSEWGSIGHARVEDLLGCDGAEHGVAGAVQEALAVRVTLATTCVQGKVLGVSARLGEVWLTRTTSHGLAAQEAPASISESITWLHAFLQAAYPPAVFSPRHCAPPFLAQHSISKLQARYFGSIEVWGAP